MKKYFIIVAFLLLPYLTHAQELKLPYIAPENRLVTRGYNTTTHKNYGLYADDRSALDFVLNGCDSFDKSVVSVLPGMVHKVKKSNSGWGNNVIIENSNGTFSRYAHLNKVEIEINQEISQGQILGTEGNTGSVEGVSCSAHPGTHLHFAMYDSDGFAYKPEPMSGYTNFTAGNWYTSDNELYVEEDTSTPPSDQLGSDEDPSGDSGGLWSRVGDFFSNLWESVTGSVGGVLDQVFVPIEELELIDAKNDDILAPPVDEENEEPAEDPIYALELSSQSEQNLTLKVGQTAQLEVTFKNTGNQVWRSDFVSLNIDEMKNSYPQSFYHSLWFTSRRPVKLSQDEVSPGEVETFNFMIQAPENLAGQTVDVYFRPVMNSGNIFSWLGSDYRVHWKIEVIDKVEETILENDLDKGLDDGVGGQDDGGVDFNEEKEEVLGEKAEADDEDISTPLDDPLDEEDDKKEEDENEYEYEDEDEENDDTSTPLGESSNDGNQEFQNFLRRRRGDSIPPDGEFYLSDLDSESIENTNEQTVKINFEADEDIAHSFATEEVQSEDDEPELNSPNWMVELIYEVLLSIGEGIKKVFLWVRDSSNNMSLFESEIRLDTVSPSSTFDEIASHQQDSNFNLTWQIIEEGSGVAYSQVQYRQDEESDWEYFADEGVTSELIEASQINFSGQDGEKYIFRLRSIDLAGNVEEWSDIETTQVKQVSPTDYLKIVINEVAWGGTKKSANDEWIELYNNTENILDLAGWKIKIGEQEFDLEGTIDGYDFFTLTRSEGEQTIRISWTKEQRIYWEQELSDAGDYIELKNPSDEIVDYVDCLDGWFAGGVSDDDGFISMERILTAQDSRSENWGDADITKLAYRVGDGSHLVEGTPGWPNTASYTGNLEDYTVIEEGSSADLHLSKAGSPYFFKKHVYVGGNFTVDPGVLIRVAGSRSNAWNEQIDNIRVSGSCDLSGTPAEPIVITSSFDQDYSLPVFPGLIEVDRNSIYSQWGGIDCRGGANIDYTQFRHGSSMFFPSDSTISNSQFTGMRLRGLSLQNSPSAHISNNTFVKTKSNYRQHIFLDGALNINIDGNDFRNSQEVVRVSHNTGLRIENNSSNVDSFVNYYTVYRRAVGVHNASSQYVYMTGPSYWGKNENMFYYIFGPLVVYNTLEIAPGSLVKFSSYDSSSYAYRTVGLISVSSNNEYGTSASLIANGTEGQEIVFTSDLDSNYSCPSSICNSTYLKSGRRFDLSVSNGSILMNNVLICKAQQRYHGPRDTFSITNSLVNITNTTFKEDVSATFDQFLRISNPLEGSSLVGNNFYNTGKILRINQGGFPIEIKHNNFDGSYSSQEAIWGYIDAEFSFDTIDMTENWWGDARGPVFSDETQGANLIAGDIDYSDWAVEQY